MEERPRVLSGLSQRRDQSGGLLRLAARSVATWRLSGVCAPPPVGAPPPPRSPWKTLPPGLRTRSLAYAACECIGECLAVCELGHPKALEASQQLQTAAFLQHQARERLERLRHECGGGERRCRCHVGPFGELGHAENLCSGGCGRHGSGVLGLEAKGATRIVVAVIDDQRWLRHWRR